MISRVVGNLWGFTSAGRSDLLVEETYEVKTEALVEDLVSVVVEVVVTIPTSVLSFPVYKIEVLMRLLLMLQPQIPHPFQNLHNINGRHSKLSSKRTLVNFTLDTWASHHMIGYISLLAQLVAVSACSVGFVDGNNVFATHLGIFPISNHITLVDVLYVPMPI